MTKPIDLKTLRQLAEAATPGPWRHSCDVEQISDGGKGYPLDYYPDCIAVVLEGAATPTNMDYIAAANPAVVLSLLDQLEKAGEGEAELMRLIGRLNTERDEARAFIDILAPHSQKVEEELVEARPTIDDLLAANAELRGMHDLLQQRAERAEATSRAWLLVLPALEELRAASDDIVFSGQPSDAESRRLIIDFNLKGQAVLTALEAAKAELSKLGDGT